MRSLLGNYFSRLKPIEDISSIENEEFEEIAASQSPLINNQYTGIITDHLKKELGDLTKIKYIDDSDSLDSATNLMNESSEMEQEDCDHVQLEQNQQVIKENNERARIRLNSNLIENLNIQQLIAGQSVSNKQVLKTLKNVTENLRTIADDFNSDSTKTDVNTPNYIDIKNSLNEIKSWLCLIKKLTLECQDQFRKKMSEKSHLPQIVEDEDDNDENSPDAQFTPNDILSMSRGELETYNQILEDQVRLLKDRLNHVEVQQKIRDKHHTDEIEHYKHTCEVIRSERKRLKTEKVELLSQTKDLYKKIDSKENEIRDFLKHYEAKTKETSFAVKKLIDSKAMIEKEKIDLQSNLFELMEERNELKLVTESKNATITKLQKQIFELETKSVRLSLSKESDFGYVSSKSRDTLSTSLIEANKQPNNSGKRDKVINQTAKSRTKKEDRSMKCKSNDFQTSLYEKNSQNTYFGHQKLKIRMRNKSHQQLDAKKSAVDYEHELNKAYDSTDFIDLENDNLDKSFKQMGVHDKIDEDKRSPMRQSYSTECILKNSKDDTQSALDSALKIEKKITNPFGSTPSSSSSSQEASCTSSIVSFTNSSTAESSGISSSSNLPHSVSASPKSHNSANPLQNVEMVQSSEKLTLSMISSKSVSSAASSPTNSPSNTSPFILNQSLTICEDDDYNFNKTFNDFGNTSQYSIKQPLSMSMSMQTPGSVSRSSRLLSSIIKMSTTSSTASPRPSLQKNSSIFSTVNTTETATKVPKAKRSILTNASCNNNSSILLNSLKYQSSRPNGSVSQSLYSIIDSSQGFNQNSATSITKMNKLIDSNDLSDQKFENKLDYDNASSWTPAMVKMWLLQLGFHSAQIKNAIKTVKNGKMLLNLSDSELEKLLLLNNGLHKRKIKLAMDEIKYPEKCKYDKLNEITNEWLCDSWLKEVGLCQLYDAFKLHLVDGRVLASLTKKDLEKYFCLCKKNMQTSLFLGVDLLRKYDFDIDSIKKARSNVLNDQRPMEVSLWTNENFSEWLKLVNLQSFTGNLDESGIHGALVVDNLFNVDFLYSSLRVGDEPRYFNMKKILEDEIKLLKKTKNSRQEMVKSDSTFLRSLNSFRSDKILSFRGSLGRALGKKIKRDISSPLIDDDTYKRIEFSHKIVDMKNYATATSSAV